MYYYIFETTNVITNEKYRGIHCSKKLTDKYLGSGVALRAAKQKYGKENFIRKELEYCMNLEELLEREKLYITDAWLEREDTYNISRGGICSIGKVVKKSEEARRNISEGMKKKYAEGFSPVAGKNLGVRSEEQKKNISDGMKRVYAEGVYTGSKGKTWEMPELSEEVQEKKTRAIRAGYDKRRTVATMIQKNNEIILKLKF